MWLYANYLCSTKLKSWIIYQISHCKDVSSNTQKERTTWVWWSIQWSRSSQGTCFFTTVCSWQKGDCWGYSPIGACIVQSTFHSHQYRRLYIKLVVLSMHIMWAQKARIWHLWPAKWCQFRWRFQLHNRNFTSVQRYTPQSMFFPRALNHFNWNIYLTICVLQLIFRRNKIKKRVWNWFVYLLSI